MDKLRNIKLILENKIISIIRSDFSEDLDKVVEVLLNSGIKIIEVSFNTPGALKWIEKLARKYKDDILIGAGTVIDSQTAVSAISAGAKFIVSPVYKKSVVQTCSRYSVISIPGVLTPTEALVAYESGADFVKIFPAGSLGPDYIKAIKAPLPQLQVIPVGGINLSNARIFIDCGASALAIGSSLVGKEAIYNKNYKLIQANAKKLIQSIGHSADI